LIIFDEKFVGLWFLATIPGSQDWLAGLSEIVPDEKYRLTYRFRYYTGDQSKNPFDDADKKNWYDGEVTGTRAYCIASLRMVAKQLHDMAVQTAKAYDAKPEKLYEVINDGDLRKAIETYMSWPCAYVRAETNEEGMKRQKEYEDERKPMPWEKR
jgi:hypothetical protein